MSRHNVELPCTITFVKISELCQNSASAHSRTGCTTTTMSNSSHSAPLPHWQDIAVLTATFRTHSLMKHQTYWQLQSPLHVTVLRAGIWKAAHEAQSWSFDRFTIVLSPFSALFRKWPKKTTHAWFFSQLWRSVFWETELAQIDAAIAMLMRLPLMNGFNWRAVSIAIFFFLKPRIILESIFIGRFLSSHCFTFPLPLSAWTCG